MCHRCNTFTFIVTFQFHPVDVQMRPDRTLIINLQVVMKLNTRTILLLLARVSAVGGRFAMWIINIVAHKRSHPGISI